MEKSSVAPDQPNMIWHSEADTAAAATALAQQLQKHNIHNLTIFLHGGLGAGKTTFTRYFLQALGVTGRIKSPTYALLESYEVDGFTLSHFDFYRFNDPLEWEDAGFRDVFSTTGIRVVEWSEQAKELLPEADLEIFITSVDEGKRAVIVKSTGTQGENLLNSWLINQDGY